jgi:hypothetical protein
MTEPMPTTGPVPAWDASRLVTDDPHRPTVAVVAPRWESGSESGWITRQVAGALACVADVHVITPQGSEPGRRVDSVFSLHQTATPLDPMAERRRDLVVEAVCRTGGVVGRTTPPELDPLYDRGLVEPWRATAAVLSDVRPDAVVIADHRQMGALEAVEEALPGVPVTLLALGADSGSLNFPHYDRLFDRADTVLAVSEGERAEIVGRHAGPDADADRRVHRIGAPLAANISVLGEPNPWVGDNEYVLVIAGADSRTDDEAVGLSRLVRLRFPEYPVAISYTDTFVAWHQGRPTPGWPVERSSDMARLMAWARVVVDLRPGPLFARRCVDALLFGTPIVVPAGSRACEHAQAGGGLWFTTPAELLWCVEAMLDPPTRRVFSRQGRTYAEDRYGSTQRFVDRVVGATGLAVTDATAIGRTPGARSGSGGGVGGTAAMAGASLGSAPAG